MSAVPAQPSRVLSIHVTTYVQPVLSDTTEEQQTTGEINWESKDRFGRWCVMK